MKKEIDVLTKCPPRIPSHQRTCEACQKGPIKKRPRKEKKRKTYRQDALPLIQDHARHLKGDLSFKKKPLQKPGGKKKYQQDALPAQIARGMSQKDVPDLLFDHFLSPCPLKHDLYDMCIYVYKCVCIFEFVSVCVCVCACVRVWMWPNVYEYKYKLDQLFL